MLLMVKDLYRLGINNKIGCIKEKLKMGDQMEKVSIKLIFSRIWVSFMKVFIAVRVF